MANRIKEIRKERGLTLLQLAERLGLSESTIQRYESGNIKNLKYETIVALAEILRCSPAYMMGWEDQSSDKYYLDPATADKSQEVYDKMRILFDAAQDAEPDDIQMAADFLIRMKRTNPDG